MLGLKSSPRCKFTGMVTATFSKHARVFTFNTCLQSATAVKSCLARFCDLIDLCCCFFFKNFAAVMLHDSCVCLHTLIFTYTVHWVSFSKILKHTPHFAYNNILRNKEMSKRQAKSPKTRRNRLKMKVKLPMCKPGRRIQAWKCCSLIHKLLA
jgi:hypothetical protein